jgi:membrane protein DedA with SNARE-associated domain
LPDDQRAALALRVVDRRTALSCVERAQKAADGRWHDEDDECLVTDGDHQASPERPKKTRVRTEVAKQAAVSERQVQGCAAIRNESPAAYQRIVTGQSASAPSGKLRRSAFAVNTRKELKRGRRWAAFLLRGLGRVVYLFRARAIEWSHMEDLAQQLLDLIRTHSDWAAVVMFVTAFGESFAFVSLAFPGTTVLIAAGTLMASGSLPYGSVLAGAVLGAVLGDSVSYWIGRRFGPGIARRWPFSRNPELLPRGIGFFERHGGKSVFIGRFFGPIRAVIPLTAGIMKMPGGRFWFANVTSALVWAPMLMFVGDAVGEAGERAFGSGNTVLIVFGALTLFGIAVVVWAAMRGAGPKA